MVGSASSLLRRSSLVFTQLLRRWFRDPPTPLSPVEASTLFCVFPQRGVLFVSFPGKGGLFYVSFPGKGLVFLCLLYPRVEAQL